jgi:hypothetical protein
VGVAGFHLRQARRTPRAVLRFVNNDVARHPARWPLAVATAVVLFAIDAFTINAPAPLWLDIARVDLFILLPLLLIVSFAAGRDPFSTYIASIALFVAMVMQGAFAFVLASQFSAGCQGGLLSDLIFAFLVAPALVRSYPLVFACGAAFSVGLAFLVLRRVAMPVRAVLVVVVLLGVGAAELVPIPQPTTDKSAHCIDF